LSLSHRHQPPSGSHHPSLSAWITAISCCGKGRARRRSPDIWAKIGRCRTVGCKISVRWINTSLSVLTKVLYHGVAFPSLSPCGVAIRLSRADARCPRAVSLTTIARILYYYCCYVQPTMCCWIPDVPFLVFLFNDGALIECRRMEQSSFAR
jgi:hypothetical protein